MKLLSYFLTLSCFLTKAFFVKTNNGGLRLNSINLQTLASEASELSDGVTTNSPNSLSSSPRVYKSKIPSRPPTLDGSQSQFQTRVLNSNSPFVLSSPYLLIRYKVPKTKTKLKIQLEELQSVYKDSVSSDHRSTNDFSSRSSTISSSYEKDGFSVKFDPTVNSAVSKKGGKVKSREERLKEADQDKLKTASDNKRFNKHGDRLDDEIEDIDEDSATEIEEDYYGDEEPNQITSLSAVSADYLREMESDGYSLEDIQMSLYGEYGLKVSLSALKKRLIEDKSERKSKTRTGKTRREKNKARQNRVNPVDNTVTLPEEGSIPIGALAELIGVGGGEVVKYLMLNKGIMLSMNQHLDVSIGRELVLAFGKELAQPKSKSSTTFPKAYIKEKESIDGGIPRPPIVTIMGHVDHGKTTLLDTIRETQIALGEAGGITQGISAFKVKTMQGRDITFIDTPGHAAFSEMRKRGANITDVVVLVVAADDGIMEQTLECIAAAKSANCPIVVAVNKIDKDGANPQKVLEDLMAHDVIVEEFGGDAQSALISAKKRIGIEDLLDRVLLQAEIMNLVSRPVINSEGTIIEASIDKRQGVVATGIVQHGTLKIGDCVVAGPSWGRVRRLLSDQGKELKEAGPSTPVQILGLSTVPNAGDVFTVLTNDEDARILAEARQRISRQVAGSITSASILAQATGFVDGKFDNRQVFKIPIVLKGDVTGSIEALAASIESLQVSDDESICKIDIVNTGVGDVTMSDVAIANAAKAKIIAFNVGPGQNVVETARGSNVVIEYYNVVYDVLDNLEAVVKSTFAPPPPGALLGRAEIKKSFKLGKVGNVAGCTVTEGVIRQGSKVRILRGKRNQIYLGTLETLRVGKEVVSEVPSGSDCGMYFSEFQDFAEGDVVESFQNL